MLSFLQTCGDVQPPAQLHLGLAQFRDDLLRAEPLAWASCLLLMAPEILPLGLDRLQGARSADGFWDRIGPRVYKSAMRGRLHGTPGEKEPAQSLHTQTEM